jgi:hypothetical protein
MGGKSKASNTSQVIMEQQAAQEARAKEDARKARVQQGLKSIEELYEGAPVFGNRTVGVDFSGLGVGKDVGGFKVREKYGAGAAQPQYDQYGFNNPNAGQPTAGPKYDKFGFDIPAAGGGGMVQGADGAGFINTGGFSRDNSVYEGPSPAARATPVQTLEGYDLLDANGNVIYSGKSLDDLRKYQATKNESYDTGKKTGGIGQDFYDNFRNAQIDYYMPQLETQYNEAKDNLIADLARSGQSISSLKGEKFGKLDAQNLTNRASITSKADVATGELKQRVAAEKKALIDQLYATEDPDIAASQALSRVNAAKMTTPDLTSLGRMFDLGTIGQNAFGSARDTAYATGIQSGAYTPRPAGAGSGKVYA